MEKCVFCQIADHNIKIDDIFYEDESVLVMLDADWAVKGHSIVIWKQHKLNASDLTKEEFEHFSYIYRISEKTVLKTVQKERAIILKTGGLISHFHFHIYPVDISTDWQSVKDIFDKKTKYHAKRQEPANLVRSLHEAILAEL